MSFSLIELTTTGDVVTISLNSPQNLNAMSLRMVEELLIALDGSSSGARALIITGRGRGFCSGADLGGDVEPNVADYDAGAALDTHYNPLMRRLRDLEVPLVTAVNGVAAGIGASIALAGDLIVAAESAYFLQAFCRIGLVPDGGSSFLLMHSAGRPRAMEMMLLGEPVTARQAHEWGMINREVPDDCLMDVAHQYAVKLAAGPTNALCQTRKMGWLATTATFDEMLNIERGLQREAGQTEDHRHGVEAYRTRATPRFVGR